MNVGTGVEISIREPARDRRASRPVHRRDPLGHVDAERPARRSLDTSRAESSSASAPRCPFATDRRTVRLVPQARRRRGIGCTKRSSVVRQGGLSVSRWPAVTIVVVGIATGGGSRRHPRAAVLLVVAASRPETRLSCPSPSARAGIVTRSLEAPAPPRGSPATARPPFQQRQPLGEQRVLVVELREHGRVVQQHDDDEQRRDREQDRRRVGRDPEPAGDRVEAAAPGREHEQHDAGDEPEQGVALLEAAAADQLEHDQDQQQRRDRGGDRDPHGSHGLATSSCGTAYFRTIAMNSASVTLNT